VAARRCGAGDDAQVGMPVARRGTALGPRRGKRIALLGCSREPGAPAGSVRPPVGAVAAPVGAVGPTDRSVDRDVARPISGPARTMGLWRLPGPPSLGATPVARRARCSARFLARCPSSAGHLGFAPDPGHRCKPERRRRCTAPPLLHVCVDPTPWPWPSPQRGQPPSRHENLMHFRDAPSNSPGQVQRRCGKML